MAASKDFPLVVMSALRMAGLMADVMVVMSAQKMVARKVVWKATGLAAQLAFYLVVQSAQKMVAQKVVRMVVLSVEQKEHEWAM